MFTGQVDVITNTQTWQSKNYWPVDADDLAPIDISDPLLDTVLVVVTIKGVLGSHGWDYRSTAQGNCVLATATASLSSGVVTGGNGKVVVSDVGFQWQFEVSDLANLCAGTYGLVAKVTINGYVQDVIDGSIAVLQGS